MTIHQCPKCELKFAYKTEVDDHCWHDHPEFRHEYPATVPPPPVPEPHEVPPPAEPRHAHIEPSAFAAFLEPVRRRKRPAEHGQQEPPQ
jgi:hypothetical protein